MSTVTTTVDQTSQPKPDSSNEVACTDKCETNNSTGGEATLTLIGMPMAINMSVITTSMATAVYTKTTDVCSTIMTTTSKTLDPEIKQRNETINGVSDELGVQSASRSHRTPVAPVHCKGLKVWRWKGIRH